MPNRGGLGRIVGEDVLVVGRSTLDLLRLKGSFILLEDAAGF